MSSVADQIEREQEVIVVFDFGSQVTQLIARRVREEGVFSEIVPFNAAEKHTKSIPTANIKGVILSGSPMSVVAGSESFEANKAALDEFWQFFINTIIGQWKIPVFSICFGSYLIASRHGGHVRSLEGHREYGRAQLFLDQQLSASADALPSILRGIFSVSASTAAPGETGEESIVWMSHGDSIHVDVAPQGHFRLLASTPSVKTAFFEVLGLSSAPIYCVYFHPELTHTPCGSLIFRNFLRDVCHCKCDWSPEHFITETIARLQSQIGPEEHVVLAISGGLDSTVTGALLARAIGDRLHCIFVDNGLLRYKEYEQVLQTYRDKMHLNVKGVDAKDMFYKALKDATDPEVKRKAIGKLFIDVFEVEAKAIPNVCYLAQGTIFPDVIESTSFKGPSASIKSHHNVGGLPARMNLKLVEPLRLLFKDEVRKVGEALGVPIDILRRHPFPGPGLAIRIMGAVTAEKVSLLQRVDNVFISMLKEESLYDKIWQAGAILLDTVKTVGVMGDERTYQYCVALRAVTSVDGMSADFVHLPWDFLGRCGNRIINEINGVNRVVYDVTSKPPGTIEWL